MTTKGSRPTTGSAWLEQLRSNDKRVAHHARMFLGGLGPSEGWMLKDLVAGTWVEADYIRFWATVGLTRLGSEASPAADRIRVLLTDPYPAVRSTVARALLHVIPAG